MNFIVDCLLTLLAGVLLGLFALAGVLFTAVASIGVLFMGCACWLANRVVGLAR